MSTPARILMVEGDTVPPAPTAGQVLLYAKTNNTFYSLNSLGVETPLGGGGGGGVTSVAATGNNGISVTGSPITSSGTLTFGLGAITPTSVAATGTVTGSNLSGTNTGDQTITLTGDVTGSGTGSFATVLANSGATAGTYGSGTLIPVVTVDAKGRITSISTTAVSGGGSGTVTSVAASGTQGVTIGGSPITTSGTITVGLGAITPTSVAATGTVTGSNLSGTNTGDQTSVTGNAGTATTLQTGRTLSITGDLAWTSPTFNGSANVTAAGTLATVNANVGTFGSATQVPVFTVDAKGRITAVSNVTISGGGSGTVTSVAATGSADITVGGSPITTSGTLTFALANTTVTPATYGSATQVPVFAVDAKGRITSVTNTTITGGGSSTPEIVVLHYTSGASGTLNIVDAIFSQTSGVTATVTDGANSIVTFTFTGKSNPPKSIIFYGQVTTTNIFSIKTPVGISTTTVVGGGTSAAPDILTSFTASNVVTITCTPAATGAVGQVGVRAFAMVEFGF